MKKIITLALLSTVALYPRLDAAAIVDEIAAEPAAKASSEEIVAPEALVKAMAIVESVNVGKLPEGLLGVLTDIQKVNLPLGESKLPLMVLRGYLNEHWNERIGFVVNAFLKAVTTPSSEELSRMPLACSFFDGMEKDLSADEFTIKLLGLYKPYMERQPGNASFHINTARDLVACQFFSLFFGNWLSHMNVNLDVAGLNQIDMVREAINNLQGAFTLDVVGLHKYTKEQQVEILKVIAETRLKNVKINVAVDTAAGLQACLEALTDQRLSVFSSGRQIDVNVVVDFKHAAFNENAAELIAIFEGINDRAIPHVWDVMLRLNNMENVAYGDLTSIIRTVVRSSVGSNLCLGTLTPDNPSTLYVMKRVREEFAAPESKIRILDFEGSRLSEEGWEQLVLLAETGKRFSKIRLTGMPIPSPLAKRLGALRVKGINMAGCRVATEDLMEMVQGWLGEGSTLAGVDLRENGVNQSIVDLFQKAGFDAYLEDKKPPYGVMFVKPM